MLQQVGKPRVSEILMVVQRKMLSGPIAIDAQQFLQRHDLGHSVLFSLRLLASEEGGPSQNLLEKTQLHTFAQMISEQIH